MPIVNVKMLKGRTIEQKRDLAGKLTEVTVSVLKIKPEAVSVVIEELDRENWASGGVLYSDKI